MHPSLSSCVRALLVIAGAAGVSGTADAYIDWSLNGQVGYDDNPGRVEHGAQGSTTAYVGATVAVDESRPRLDTTIGANIGYLDYLQGGYTGQVNGSASVDIRYALVPKVLFWTVDDHFGQGTANVLAPASPENRIQVNTFTTGPTLVLPLNSVTRVRADARVGFDTFSDETLPNDTRYTGSLALIRQLTPLSDLSLNGDYTKVSYRYGSGDYTGQFPGETSAALESYGDYDRESAFVRYETSNKRTRWNVDLGAARINQDGQTFNSPLVRAAWDHKVSAFWSVNLAGGREYTDGAQAFGTAIDRSGIPLPNTPPSGNVYTTQTLPLTNQPMRTDSGRAGIAFVGTRTTFNAGVDVARDRFVLAIESDDNRTGADFGVTRRLTPYSDLHAGASYQVRQFVGIGESDRTTYGNVLYNYRIDPSFQLYCGYNFEKRVSTSYYSYTDNRVMIGVRYTPTHRTGHAPLQTTH